jgi:hypothetical protein
LIQDYRVLTDQELEILEKQSLRLAVQAIQEYSAEARSLFENTLAARSTEVIVLAEDVVQYALEVAELYPINRRFAGFIDYKRVRWMPASFGLLPQVLLVDAKASTENSRDTLQQSQLPMDADFVSNGATVTMSAGVAPHLNIQMSSGKMLPAVTTSLFVHFHYTANPSTTPPYKTLHAIYVLSLPHQRLKHVYNPNSGKTFFGQGKHSPKRSEEPRIRVYFEPLRRMCPWRLQMLRYDAGSHYTTPMWRDQIVLPGGALSEINTRFEFIGR